LRTLLEVAFPILGTVAFPILLLSFPTEGTMIKAWSAAMLLISFTAGHEISHALSRKVACGWLAADVALLVVLVMTGVLSLQQGNALPYRMGILSAIILGLGLPAAALQAKVLEKRRRKASDVPHGSEGGGFGTRSAE
jgi:hypothetical protein